MADRPLTQREIKARKKKRSEVHYVTLYNPSKGQLIPIQLSAPPGVDFFRGEQTIHLKPRERNKFPAHRLNKHQINNLEKKGMLKVFSGSEYLGNTIT